MANIADGLTKFIGIVGEGITATKKAVDKVLWGSVNEVTAAPAPGTSIPTTPKKTKVGSFIQSGLFNALDALISVDLCNILNYIYSINTPKKRSETPTKIEKALYDLQDKATLVREAIDKFYAFPSDILDNLKDPNPSAPVPAPGTTPTTNQPTSTELAGSAMQKYNLGIVSRYTSDVFKAAGNTQALTQGAIAEVNSITAEAFGDPEIKAALSLIPNFNANINSLQDYINFADKYADWRAIPNEEFQEILKKIDTVRAVCVTIEGFSLGGALDLVQQFTGLDIRSQIAKLNDFIDVKRIVPTLKDIDKALRSFIATCKSIQGYLRIGRGIVKIALVLIKIFKYISKLISSIPLPLMYATFNVTAKLEDAKEKAKENVTGLEKFLGQLNALLALIIEVVRYIQQNTEQLLQRVDILLSKLQGCDALTDSSVLEQLQQTRQSLSNLSDELTAIIKDYDSVANPDSADYGSYTIRVVDEELVDEAITNRRRRGIALDASGILVAQSDLTFATNTALIIEETKIKLVTLGLISADQLSETDLVILEATSYLGSENFNMTDLTAADTEDTIGLSAFFKNQPGNAALRKRVRSKLKATDTAAKKAIASQMTTTSQFLGVVNSRR